MISLFVFYKFSFLVSAVSSSALAWTGTHYLPRGRVMDIFALSQLALIGNLIAKLIFADHYSLYAGLFLSYIFYLVGSIFIAKLVKNQKESSEWMIGLYVFFSALQYLLIGFFPVLDSHLSVGFFGNLVTSTFTENLTMFCVFSLSLYIAMKANSFISKRTLDQSVLNIQTESKFEFLLFSIILVTSLYGLGFFYTLGFLLLPTLMFGKRMRNQKFLSFIVLCTAFSASLFGLALSLLVESISTSAAQIMFLVVFGALSLLLSFNKKTSNPKGE